MSRRVLWIAVTLAGLMYIAGCGGGSGKTIESIAATSGTPQSTPINTPFAAPLVATVTTGGNPVSGAVVTFAVDLNPLDKFPVDGTFPGGAFAAMVTTGANGVATSPTLTANGRAGFYTVTATVAGVAAPADFNLMNTAGAAASLTATSGTPQSTPIDTPFAAPLAVTVVDSGGNPVSGAVVTFSAPFNVKFPIASGSFAAAESTAMVTTGANGVATSPTFTADGVAGSYTVTATVAGVAAPADFSLTNTAPAPSISSLSPSSIVAGTAAFTLVVDGTNFLPNSTVQWNGSNRSTTYESATQLTASITAADIATPTYVAVTVLNPAPGGGTSANFSITPMWPKPAPGTDGFLVDAPSQLASLSELNAFGGPLFTAWNPSPANAAGPGMKIMMFGTPDSSCPANTQGPISSFADAVLISDGYRGQTSAVPANLRFEPIPMAACTPASGGKYGPVNVFFDGSQLWFYTSSLGNPSDLLKPFSSAGQNGNGANANIVNASVDYLLTNLGSTIQPWALNKRARLAALAQVVSIRAQDTNALTQTKQVMGITFINTVCIGSNPANHCQIYWQFAQAIAQSNISDWTTASSFQYPNFFLDPAQDSLAVVDVALVPVAGQTVNDAGSGLPLFTSRGQPTQHTGFEPMQFDIEIDFSQFENAIRIVSALILGQPVGSDAACAQCVQVFGTSWNDPRSWVVHGLLSQQEIYDASGTSGAIFGGYSWFYGGTAP